MSLNHESSFSSSKYLSAETIAKYFIELINISNEKFFESKIKEMAEKSFFVMDYTKIASNIEKFKSIEFTNRIKKSFYEVSVNNDPVLLKILSENNFGFKCFSLQEVRMVREISLENPIIMGPIIPESELEQLTKLKVDYFLVDDLEKIKLIAEYSPQAKVLLYIKLSSKDRFRLDFTQASLLLKSAAKNQIKVLGLYIPLEAEENLTMKKQVLEELIEAYKKLFISKKFEVKILLGIQNSLNILASLANCEEAAVEKCVVFNSLVCEDYLTVAEAMSTVKVCEEKKEIKYYLKNADLYLGRIYFNLKEKLPKLNEQRETEFLCSFYGPTCDSSDCILENVAFIKLNVDEHIVFENMGFCSTVLSGSKFNGFKENYTVFRVFNETNI